MFEQFIGTKPVEERHRFDVASLERYLMDRIEGLRGPLQVEEDGLRLARRGAGPPCGLRRTPRD